VPLQWREVDLKCRCTSAPAGHCRVNEKELPPGILMSSSLTVSGGDEVTHNVLFVGIRVCKLALALLALSALSACGGGGDHAAGRTASESVAGSRSGTDPDQDAREPTHDHDCQRVHHRGLALLPRRHG
jgi:hypothetical protein